jgi:hypothetical protein
MNQKNSLAINMAFIRINNPLIPYIKANFCFLVNDAMVED